MTPTIRDVARAAGVSIATVSHALSGNRPVRPATRRRIEDAAERLGYRPNQLAASMITGRTRTLGLVVPDIANPFFGQLVRAVERAAAERGYTVVSCSSELDPELEQRYVETLADKRIDALVYLAGTEAENAAVLELAASGTPLVLLDEAMPWRPAGASVVTVDNAAGGRLAARHLLELGHRRLAVVTGPAGLPTARDRAEGFRAEARDALVRHAAYTIEAGLQAVPELLAAEPNVTALFCGNDLLALGALQAARDLGRADPARLSVVGFDDVFVSALVTPALTTIRQPHERLGREAAGLAIDLIEGQAAGPERRTLPVELVVRESTGRAALRRLARTAT